MSFFTNRFKFNLQEISGGFGDLGTFIPLAVPMVLVCGMDAGSLLFWAGFFSITTGLLFGLPIPVQPMKAIAAVAIAEGLTTGQIAAAGLGTAVFILLLCWGNWLEKSIQLIPKEIVRGIQLGIGAKLVLKGASLVLDANFIDWRNLFMIMACIIIILAGFKFKRLPSALLVFCLGLFAIYFSAPSVFQELKPGWHGLVITLPGTSDWITGFSRGSLSQIPLTLLNSVIAVCALSHSLFPGRGVPEKKMAFSVALMNITGCLFGALPMCHGSGGLAAQYRFGGRSGGSVMFIGLVKITTGILLGGAAITILSAYPMVILGLLLTVSGLELSRSVIKNENSREYMVCICTALVILAFNTALGFLSGICLYILLHFYGTRSERIAQLHQFGNEYHGSKEPL
jgi:MFS superfamily sulfate permease-like transporter